ncbi:indole-3-glycerol phosphate synthase TrpC [Thiohalorhabdus methylotrophus]|uniref:Indole-3-glycerol phosphate synthase n=1 Tax=Thiohalorhabdus methylotrophus TaxID=3242694 RepID=A0ABV4TTM6_9GAMM
MSGSGRATILEEILGRKAEELAERRAALPEPELRERLAAGDAPPLRDFMGALQAKERQARPAVIAEVKRASPSAGVIRTDFDPVAIGTAYARGGAAALSVLTDRDFFGGSDDYLRQAREASGLPALRKDFTIDPYQVSEARLLGADCVLLIVAALDDDTLAACLDRAAEEGIAALVEVHDAAELDRALGLGAELVGVNNRDLHTFETRLATSLELADRAPEGITLVAESGIHSRSDIDQLRSAGIPAFLVGEWFMRAPDPGVALAELLTG